MGMDFWIMDTRCTKKKPYFQVDGNLEEDEYCNETLYLGLAHEAHYQSLILSEETKVVESKTEDLNEDTDEEEDDVSEDDTGSQKMIDDTDDNENHEDKDALEKDRCPTCKKVLKNVLLHIKKAKNCNAAIS